MMKRSLYILSLCLLLATVATAGNPDRQGEAGAVQLLLNPWASSAGLHTLNTSFVKGVESLRLNPAGLARINKTEFALGSANYLQGADIRLQALGLSQKVGENSAFGFSIMSVNFGDILVTTDDLPDPDPNGPTFNINFFNIGLSYAHVFENKVSVGVTLRGISESTSDVAAFGFAVDAGVQYVTGENDNFKFGISLRNVGSRMSFTGQGLSTAAPAPDGGAYNLTLAQRSAGYELPSTLNIGASYDFLFSENNHRVTILGNFVANSFSRDEIGVGVEYALKERFMLRGAYRTDIDKDVTQEAIYSGPSAGATIMVPLSKERKSNTLAIDYAYRATKVWDGTHNFGIRINL
jgi:hypothetical protein